MSEGTPLTGIDARTHAPVRVAATAAAPSNSHNSAHFGGWRGALRDAVVAELADFVSRHCAEALGDSGVDIATDVLMGFLHSGKCLRSTFMYLGWLCGADDNEPALRAAASFELLHAFALLQDDVMDGSAVRRGRPSAHVSVRALASRARAVWLTRALRRIGRCTARRSVPGVGRANAAGQRHRPQALSQAWPRYDAMRTELAVGQFADLVNDAGGLPHAGPGARRSPAQIGQLHRAPASGDRRDDGGM